MIRLLHVRTLKLREFDEGAKIPPYLILSHKWGEEKEEVSYRDMVDQEFSRAQSNGLKKVRRFCKVARKVKCDYVWIDTCCINRLDNSELIYSITRMYRWYQKAVACVVYLNDVEQSLREGLYDKVPVWFERGWTLQELLAPKKVLFFDQDWVCIGNRARLAPAIHRLTGIKKDALYGKDPREFSVLERFRWAMRRITKLPEDRVYSLLGLFDVFMQPKYGEGDVSALRRLIKKHGRMEELPYIRAERDMSVGRSNDVVSEYVHFLESQEHKSDIRAEMKLLRRDVAGYASQEESRHNRDNIRRSKSIADGVSDEKYGSEVSRHLPVLTSLPAALPPPTPLPAPNRHVRFSRERGPQKELWIQITKDIVVKQAIQEEGYEFDETNDFYYIFSTPSDKDLVHLFGLSDDIRNERHRQIREIEWEDRISLSPIVEEPQYLAIEPPRSRDHQDRDRKGETYIEPQQLTIEPATPRHHPDRDREGYIERVVVCRGDRSPPLPRRRY